jgi:hypothetical protein
MISKLRFVPWPRRWACIATAIGGVTLLAALAAPAQAATTVGQTGPVEECEEDRGQVQESVSSGPTYTIPFSGVITSFTAVGPAGEQTKLLILQPVSAGTYNVVAKSEYGTYTNVGVGQQTFPTRISVQAGQVIGDYGLICFSAGSAGDVRRWFSGPEPAQGSNQSFPTPGNNVRIVLSATLEADCDQDGFGDETQDPDATGPTCPPPQPQPKADRTLTLDSNKGKVEKGRKVRLTGQIDAPLNEAACEPNQTVELQRKKKKAPETAFATFKTVQTDQAGNFADKVRVKKTRIYRAVVRESASCDEELSNTQKVRVQKKKAAQEA